MFLLVLFISFKTDFSFFFNGSDFSFGNKDGQSSCQTAPSVSILAHAEKQQNQKLFIPQTCPRFLTQTQLQRLVLLQHAAC